jgi:ABC-type taurine transport system ATPase subunit
MLTATNLVVTLATALAFYVGVETALYLRTDLVILPAGAARIDRRVELTRALARRHFNAN